MEIKGLIHNVDNKHKTISIKLHNRLHHYYFQNNLMKRFRKYLYEGNCVTLVCEDSKEDRGGYSSHRVIYVKEVFVPTFNGKKVLYSKRQLNKSLYKFFESLDYKMFLDIEMTMPPYKTDSSFVSEIVQAGFFIVDKQGEVVLKENYYIRPTKFPHINRRTRTFLHIDDSVIEKEAISYPKFYRIFKNILNKYRPAILTFGKNDKLFMDRSYTINELPSLSFMSRFINLSQLIKNYYELTNDPGLFVLYEKYTGISNYQSHDALEDAEVTYVVYQNFIKDIKNNKSEGELLRKLA